MKTMLRTSATILLLLVLLGPVPGTAAGSWEVLGAHTVLPGETLFCIGRGYGVDPWAIATQNRLINVGLIYPGAVLDIPNAPMTLPAGPTCARQFSSAPVVPTCEPCTCQHQHLIVTGETLTKIAARYGTSTDAIVQCNCLRDPNYIRIGDTLCVP